MIFMSIKNITVFVEHLKSERLDRLAKKWFREEYNENYSGEDNYDDDDEYDDEEDDKDILVVSYKSNHENVQEIDTKEIEYQLRGEKLPSVILPPGLLQLGRLYSLFFYLQGMIPGSKLILICKFYLKKYLRGIEMISIELKPPIY